MPCCNGCKYKALAAILEEEMPLLKPHLERNDTEKVREIIKDILAGA